MSPHIETIVTLFAKKERRERLLFLASRADRWDQFRHDLLHDTRALDERALTPLPSVIDGDALIARLRAKASDIAYCISDALALDDRELALAKAIGLAEAAEDSLVFCVRSRCAFYKNHETERYVLAPRT